MDWEDDTEEDSKANGETRCQADEDAAWEKAYWAKREEQLLFERMAARLRLTFGRSCADGFNIRAMDASGTRLAYVMLKLGMMGWEVGLDGKWPRQV